MMTTKIGAIQFNILDIIIIVIINMNLFTVVDT